jgi:hypothetical protein
MQFCFRSIRIRATLTFLERLSSLRVKGSFRFLCNKALTILAVCVVCLAGRRTAIVSLVCEYTDAGRLAESELVVVVVVAL